MASISTDKNGNRRILFVGKDRKRKALYLGPVPMNTARNICQRVQWLNAADIHGDALDNATAEWLATKCDGLLRDKLAALGLCTRRERATLGPFLAGYVQKRIDVKPGTQLNWEQTVRSLLDFFGADRALASITPGDAADWQLWLLTRDARKQPKANRKHAAQGAADPAPPSEAAEAEAVKLLAKNTVRKRVRNAKQFFADAVSRDLIRHNPFADLAGAVGGNRERDYFVTREEADKVLDKCPDAQWRLLFALSRYGGLRCPSEHLALTWDEVDLPGGRLTVHSPKTEHHPGGACRVIPIFPELRPYLEDCHALLPEGAPSSQHVITRYRDSNANLRTQLKRIIKRAGLEPWPKLFHNLRATRETELAEQFPMHVVCKWIGNSPKVAAAHYLQVTDEHFAKASLETTQNPTQPAAIGTATERQGAPGTKPDATKMPVILGTCPSVAFGVGVVNTCLVGPPGFEPGTKGL